MGWSSLVPTTQEEWIHNILRGYRRLNAVTMKDTYPLPLVHDISDQISGSSIYSTLDIKAAYWQLPVATQDILKTAFNVP